jgi:hypothetical protein
VGYRDGDAGLMSDWRKFWLMLAALLVVYVLLRLTSG